MASGGRSPGTPFTTDVSIKGSLNAGLLPGRSRGAQAGSSGSTSSGGGAGGGGTTAESELSSAAYLDKFEEELHKKVDADIEVLVEGLEECVELAKVGNKDKFKAAQDALEVELKAESMVRATESLLSLSHTLKLLFLLNTEDEDSARIQENQQEQSQKELDDLKARARAALAKLMAKR